MDNIRNINWADIVTRFNDTSLPDSNKFRQRFDAISRRVSSLIEGSASGVEVPEAPTGVIVTSPNPLTALVRWSAVSNAEYYNIYGGPIGSVLSVLGNTGVDSFVANNVGPGVFSFQVAAVNSAGEGPRSAVVSVEIEDLNTPLNPPDEITGLAVTNTPNISTGVDFTWDAFTGTTTSARIERRQITQNSFATIALGVTGTTYNDTEALQTGTYSYRIIGRNDLGIESLPSAEVEVVVGSAPDTEAPPVPTMISADAEGGAGQDPVMTCVCSSVFAGDLAGYQFGISDQNDPATAEWSPLFQDRVGYISEHAGGILQSGTTYYVWARSVDSTVPANVSDASPTPSSELVVLTIPIGAPAKPGNVAAASENLGEIHITWSYPTNGQALDSFELWRMDNVTETFIKVAEPEFTLRNYTDTNLQVDRLYTYKLRSVGLAGATSAYSDEVSLYAQGQDATGGGVGQIQGPFDGDTAFGADYRVPGVTFDYAIDARTFTNQNINSVAEAFGIIRSHMEFPVGSPLNISLAQRGDTPTQIAILLPEKIETRPLNMSRNGETYTVNGNIKSYGQAFLGVNNKAFEIHLIAPWAAPSSDVETAAEEVRDQDAGLDFGYVYRPETVLSNGMILDLALEKSDSGVHLWNWDVEASAANTVFIGRPPEEANQFSNMISGQNEVYFHLCQFKQENTDVAVKQTVVRSHISRLNLEGCYFDTPLGASATIILDNVPYGDMTWDRVNSYRSGLSFAILVDTATVPTLDNGLSDPGTLNLTNFVVPDAWSNRFAPVLGQEPLYEGFIRCSGLHQGINLDSCDILAVRETGVTSSVWPPQDFLAEAINDQSHLCSAPIVTVDNVPALGFEEAGSNGHFTKSVTINNCRLFSQRPKDGPVVISASSSINVSNSLILTGQPAGEQTLLLGDTGNSACELRVAADGKGEESSSTLFSTFNLLDNNVISEISTFETDYSLVSTEACDAVVGANEVSLGPISVDQGWANFTGPDWNPPLDPPDVGSVLNMWDAIGNTTTQNKELRRPVLMADRAPRVSGELPFVRHWGMGYPDFSGNPDPQFSNILQWPDGNGNFLTYHATQNGSQTGMPPEFGGSGSFKALFDPSYITHPDDGKTLLIKDVDCFRPANDGRDPFHFSSGESWAAPNPDGESIHTEHRRPVGGKVIMENVKIDLENIDEEGSEPKWGLRGYNLPDFEVVDCDFMRDANEHAIYINPFEDVIVRRSTFFEIASQAIQLTSRASGEGGETEINNGPIERSTYTLLEDCHFIDTTAAHMGTGGTRPSYSATLSNRGTCANPGKIEVKDCSFVCDVENAGIGVEGYGSGVKPGARSMGQMVTGFEKGMSSYTDPADSTRANGVAQVHSEIILSNNLFHRMNPGRNSVSLKSAECITIENCVWISDYNGQGVAGSGQVYYRPLTIDVDVSLIRERQAIRSRYLLVRNNWAPPETVGSPIAYHGENRPYNVDPSQGIAYFDLHCPGEEIVYDLWTTDDIGFGPGVLYRGDIRPGFSLTPTT